MILARLGIERALEDRTAPGMDVFDEPLFADLLGVKCEAILIADPRFDEGDLKLAGFLAAEFGKLERIVGQCGRRRRCSRIENQGLHQLQRAQQVRLARGIRSVDHGATQEAIEAGNVRGGRIRVGVLGKPSGHHRKHLVIAE